MRKIQTIVLLKKTMWPKVPTKQLQKLFRYRNYFHDARSTINGSWLVPSRKKKQLKKQFLAEFMISKNFIFSISFCLYLKYTIVGFQICNNLSSKRFIQQMICTNKIFLVSLDFESRACWLDIKVNHSEGQLFKKNCVSYWNTVAIGSWFKKLNRKTHRNLGFPGIVFEYSLNKGFVKSLQRAGSGITYNSCYCYFLLFNVIRCFYMLGNNILIDTFYCYDLQSSEK